MNVRRLFSRSIIVALSLILLALASSSTQAVGPERVLTEEVSGHIDEDTVWTAANSPYVVTDDVTVDQGITLTIEPGVVVKFNDFWDNLLVHGSLVAEGTAAQPIVFTSLLDDAHGGDTNGDGAATSPAPRDWGDIDFSATASGVLEHVWVGYGGGEWAWANVEIHGTSDVAIRDSTIAYGDDRGIYVDGGSPVVEQNEIRHNTGSGIDVSGASAAPLIITNRLLYNDRGINVWNSAWPTIRHNVMYSNTTYGVNNATGSVCVDARHNYWGDPGGPHDPSSASDACGLGGHENPDGDQVSDSVNYEPYVQQTPFFVWTAPAEDLLHLLHDTELLAWAAMGIEPITDTINAEIQLISATQTSVLTTGVPVVASVAWDTTGVPDGWYELRAIFRDAASQVVGETARQVLVNNAVAWHGGTLTADETWSAGDVHVLERDVTVATGSTLTIEPGAVVKAAPGVGVTVETTATLSAHGTAGAPIVLTSLADDEAGGDTNLDGDQSRPLAGDWYGITLQGTGQRDLNEHVELRYVQVGHAGSLSGDEVWTPEFLHRVTGDLVVPSGRTLTVQPGAIVKLDQDVSISVASGGQIVAQGTLPQPITFTSVKDDAVGGDTNRDGGASVPGAGDWHGVILDGGEALLDHVTLRYGGGTPGGVRDETSAAVSARNNGRMAVSNSLILDPFSEGVIAWGSGSAAITNTVIAGADRGVNVDGAVRLTHCTLDDNRIGIWGHGGSLAMVNTIVANSLEAGVYQILTTDTDLRYSLVWSALGSNYVYMDDPTGVDGNLSADPLLKDPEGGDYRLDYVSPAIDAADGAAAPALDAMGAPRYDDPRTANTGLPTDGGAYADLGAYEFVETADAPIDLVVQRILGPSSATAGDAVTLQWTVVNSGTEAAVGPWHDAIWLVLSPDHRPTVTYVDEVLVGQGTTVAPGQSATFAATVPVPAAPVGDHYWRITTNARGEVFEGRNAANNAALSSTPVSLDLAPLLVDGPLVTGTLTAPAGSAWYSVVPTAGQDVQLTFSLDADDGGGTAELYVGRGYVPSRQAFDVRSTPSADGEATVTVADTVAGVYYVLAYAGGLADPQPYALSAATSDLQVASVAPESGGTGSVTLQVVGSSFPEGVQVYLMDATNARIDPLSSTRVDGTTLVATFDLSAAATGSADVVVEADPGGSATLEDGFEVTAGGSPEFWVDLTGPDALRAGRQTVYELRWGNRGSVDAPVHLLDVRIPSTVELALTPEGEPLTGSLLLLTAVPDAAEAVVPPGHSESRLLYVTPDLVSSFRLDYGSVPVDAARLADATIDWETIESLARPADMDDAEWDDLWAQLIAQLGDDWSSLLTALAEDALALNSRDLPPSAGVRLSQALLLEIDEALRTLGWVSGAESGQAPAIAADPQPCTGGNVHHMGVYLEEYGEWHKTYAPGPHGTLIPQWHHTGQDELPQVHEDRKAVNEYVDKQAQVPPARRKELVDEPGDSSDDVTAQDIRDGLSEMADGAERCDTVVFHYSGHGNEGGLETNDATVTWEEIYGILKASKANKIVLTVDACHSGGLTDMLNWFKDNTNVGAEKKYGELDPSRWTVVTAAAKDESSYEGWFSKPFFQSLEDGQSLWNAWQDNNHIETFNSSATQSPQWFGNDPDLKPKDKQGSSKDGAEDGLGDDSPVDPTDHTDGNPLGSWDPNEKRTVGYGSGGFIRGDGPILYTVLFENDPEEGATVPVQELLITDTLSASLDWSTFELLEMGFGDESIPVPAGLSALETFANIPGDPYPVEVSAELDPASGMVSWTFASRDPVTQDLPEDPFAGFLPVNDESGRGEGRVSFRIWPKESLPGGAVITNHATITFDPTYGVNPPIVTDPVTNTIDRDAPSSSVDPLPATSPETFPVSWSGDDGGGSGVAAYDVYVSTDGGPWVLWQSGITGTSASFAGEDGRTYAFYSVATDNVGHVEGAPGQPDATTTAAEGHTLFLPLVLKGE